MHGGLEDTICAIATPKGEAALDCSSERSSGTCRRFSGCALAVWPSPLIDFFTYAPSCRSCDSHIGKAERGQVVHQRPSGSGLLDEALVAYMKAPRSFTAEDVVEIQSHGGALVLEMVCKGCVESGAKDGGAGRVYEAGLSQRTPGSLPGGSRARYHQGHILYWIEHCATPSFGVTSRARWSRLGTLF